MPLETVSHEGRTTAYRYGHTGGDGSPVVFVHGSGGSHAVWKSQFRLANERPVAAVDLSGHGESDDVEAEAGWETLSAHASDVIAVAEEIGARTLVGTSLGGAVVLHTVLDRGFEPAALGLVGAGAKLSVSDDLLSWLDDDFDRVVSVLHGQDRFFHDPDEAMIEQSRAAMVDCGRRVTRRDFLTCHAFDVRADLEELDVPIIAIVGKYDQLTPVWYHEYLVDRLPDAELAVIEDAAHLVMLERPDRFNEVLTEFLDRVA